MSTDSKSKREEVETSVTVEQSVTPGLAYGGDDNLPPPPTLTTEQENRLYRKIDVRFMPIIAALYLVSFLDRSNIGNAKLQGLITQLDLTGSRYNVALTMYFISYNVFSIPANLVLKKFRPSRWLPGITVATGVMTTLMGLVKTYPQLVGLRVCVGIAEAGLSCGVFYYLTLWYPRYKLQTRIGMFWAGATFAGAFSGLLAFGISFMSGTAGLLGWSWIFIVEGLATVVVGIISLFTLVDLPNTATFLTPEERAYIIYCKKYDNSSVGEDESFQFQYVWDALLDWQVWLVCIINMTATTPVYGSASFLPSIINGFGFNTAISQLLTVPPYVVATVCVMICATWADRIKKRSPFICAGLSLCIIGFSINISHASIGVKYFGTFLIVAGGYSTVPSAVSWLSNNLAGHYKRAVGIALGVMFGNFGGVIASNAYRTRDAPRYLLGHGLELFVVGFGFVLAPIIALSYYRINARRDVLERDAVEKGTKYEAEELRRLGDRAPDFRYTL